MKTKKIATIVMVIILLFSFRCNLNFAQAATSGTDENGNTWFYNSETKTLTFTGNSSIEENASLDGHSKEPAWYKWEDGTEHLVIEEGITGIGVGAFTFFVNLKTVDMANSVTYIDSAAFEYCRSIETIKLSSNIKQIKKSAFSGCTNLKNIDLPSPLETLGGFTDCTNLQEISIPDTVRNIPGNAFLNCTSLSKIKLPMGLKKINKRMFKNCKNLKKIDIPLTVNTVYMSAFSGVAVEKIALPKNVKYIKNGAYSGQKVFKKSDDGDYDTKNLRVIEIYSKNLESVDKGAFSGLSQKVVIKVPKSKKNKYAEMFYESGLSKKVKIKAVL